MAKPPGIPLVADDGREFPEPETAHKIFNIPEILDIILDYVLHDKRQVITDNVKCCRLVSTAWLKSTSRILRRCEEALFTFNDMPSVQSPQPFETTQLRQFVTSVPKILLLDEQIPLHSIKCSRNFFHKENYAFFLEYFRTCSSGLIKLDLECAEHSYPAPLDTNVSFPKLQMFRMYVDTRKDYNVHQMEDKVDYIQSILNGSKQLKTFELLWKIPYTATLPASLSNLIFPVTLTEISLECYLRDYHLEALVNSPLLNLKTLKFCISRIALKNEILARILQNVRKTLESFHVRQHGPKQPREQVSTLQLPLMEKLEKLEIRAETLHMANDCSHMEKFVPLLNHFILKDQSKTTFRKWTRMSCFASVTCLQILMSADDFDKCTLKTLKNAFPNLEKLHISVFELDENALDFIMREMTNLKHLNLIITFLQGDLFAADHFHWSELLDSRLIGVPMNSVAALRNSPELWEHLKERSAVSIRNLTGLHTLELTFNVEEVFEISSAVFSYAFLKMPNLRKLIFREFYSVPPEMVDEWRKQGRTLEMHDFARIESEDEEGGSWLSDIDEESELSSSEVSDVEGD